MIFMIFVIIAIWMLPPDIIPLWLQICLTIFGSLHALGDVVIKYGNDN
jgi:hypothetical protein